MNGTEDALKLYDKLNSCLSELSKLANSRFLEGFPSCLISDLKQDAFRLARDCIKDLMIDLYWEEIHH